MPTPANQIPRNTRVVRRVSEFLHYRTRLASCATRRPSHTGRRVKILHQIDPPQIKLLETRAMKRCASVFAASPRARQFERRLTRLQFFPLPPANISLERGRLKLAPLGNREKPVLSLTESR